MFENFLKELEAALQAQNIYYVQPILNEYKTKFETLKTSGKTEFECMIALGDPEEIARKLVGQDYTAEDKLTNNIILSDKPTANDETQPSKPTKPKKLPTKASIICTDILYMAPITILAALGLIALAFLSALAGFAGVSYCILAWTTFSVLKQQILCFVMALFGVVMFIGGAITTIKLIISIVKSYKLYLSERKEKLAMIADSAK